MTKTKNDTSWNGIESMNDDATVLEDIYADMDSEDNETVEAANEDEVQLPIAVEALQLLDVKLSVNGVKTGLKIVLNYYGEIVSVDYYAKQFGFDDFVTSVDKDSHFWRFAERMANAHYAGNEV